MYKPGDDKLEVRELLRYGRLYYNGRDHGLEFIAFLETDAYDDMIYNVTLTED